MLNTKNFLENPLLTPWLFKKKKFLNFLADQHFFVIPKFSELEVFQPCSISVSDVVSVDVTENLD